MPVRVGAKGAWQTVEATTEPKTLKTELTPEAFEVATDLFFVNVAKK
jgi:hypothetical protein